MGGGATTFEDVTKSGRGVPLRSVPPPRRRGSACPGRAFPLRRRRRRVVPFNVVWPFLRDTALDPGGGGFRTAQKSVRKSRTKMFNCRNEPANRTRNQPRIYTIARLQYVFPVVWPNVANGLSFP